jgi:hypothetical protein
VARLRCRASGDDSSETPVQDRIKNTLSGLDALLGIDPEEEEKKKRKADDEERVKSEAKRARDEAMRSTSSVDISISPSVLDKIRQADEEREQGKGGDKGEAKPKKFNSEIAKIVEMGKRLAEKKEGEKEGSSNEIPIDEDKLREELESMMRPTELDRADVDVIRKEVFTQNTFYVTNITQIADLAPTAAPAGLNGNAGGVYVQGTLRMPREQLFETIQTSLQQRFGDKYELFMTADLTEEGDDPRGGPRVAFQVIIGTACRPQAANTWQFVFAVALALLTAGSCLQLGLSSNISLLPKETVEWLSNPNNQIDPNVAPPGLEGWDPVPYLAASLPISVSVFLTQVAHEAAHRVAAGLRKVKMGPSFFIPNGAVGSFGAVTPFKSMVQKRSDLFDVSVAGPAAAAAVASALFLAGLAFSAGGQDGLVAIPTPFFQSSLGLGSLMQAVLGDKAMSGSSVMVHPFAVAGWAGLVSTALNLLPVGSIDGGRIVQGAFGKAALSITSLFTYIGLGLGFLGSSLALPFGLYILIVQRSPEAVLQDSVTPPSSSRQVAAAALIFAAILVLLPMAPVGFVDDVQQSNLFL